MIARGASAVTIETRLAAAAISWRTRRSSGSTSVRSAMSIKSRPSTMSCARLTELAAGTGRLGPRGVERGQLADEAARLLEIVFFARVGEPDMEFGDMALAQNPADFSCARERKAPPRQCPQAQDQSRRTAATT